MEEFKVRWGDLVDKYHLAGNPLVDQTHEMRQLWALAYPRNQFFGRIRTTTQCEGINSLINAYVRKKNNLPEFINNMKTFTRNMHREVRKEIKGACAMNVEFARPTDEKIFFKCNSFGEPDIEHVVEFDKAEGILKWENHFKNNSDEDFIDDPLVMKSKGAPKRNTKFKQRRRCSNCGVSRQYNRSCPNNNGGNQDDSIAADAKGKSNNPSSAAFTRKKRKVSHVQDEESHESWDKEVATKGGRKKRS
ncbi:hypothetical protein PIB30_030256 [Stylosanthes scabra]|uniref:Protein FAR1-RELATED SEQUENCE n=1 Tax=Stylosanthes scabra TaxID=79078 RepID=A0ABU6X9Y5_9FABA|nr:hypothetical protein [Stylosanthes scabra]